MRRLILCLALVTICFYVLQAEATQFTIRQNDVRVQTGPTSYQTAPSYIGPAGVSWYSSGSVENGGYDAFGAYNEFPGYGYYPNYNSLGNLSLYRQVETFADLNIYRWLDTFTNNTDSAITQTVRFAGNFRRSQTIAYSDPYYNVFRYGVDGYTPIISLVNGNNEWADSNMSIIAYGTDYNLYSDLSLDPGESVSILHFAFLARDTNVPRDLAGDVALAISTGQNLVDNPYLAGFTQEQIDKIINFGESSPEPEPVPEPISLILMGSGLLGLVIRKRFKITGKI